MQNNEIIIFENQEVKLEVNIARSLYIKKEITFSLSPH